MENYGPSTYGDRIADVYDELYSHLADVSPVVDLLAGLAEKGRALELGIGTGRVAVPLAAAGVTVEGIDASEAMVAKLRAKAGGADIRVTLGDLADVAVEGRFRLIYVPFNTFFALTSQQEQIQCLRNVAAHLEEGGWFVMDAWVPDLTRYRSNQTLTTNQITADHVVLDASQHDPVTQTVRSSHIVLDGSGVHLYPVAVRYAWPAELDAMALVAGLELVHRYGDYDRRPFDASSPRHVSIYQLRPKAA